MRKPSPAFFLIEIMVALGLFVLVVKAIFIIHGIVGVTHHAVNKRAEVLTTALNDFHGSKQQNQHIEWVTVQITPHNLSASRQAQPVFLTCQRRIVRVAWQAGDKKTHDFTLWSLVPA